MSGGASLTLLGAGVREGWNGLRREPRQRAIALFALAVTGSLGVASAFRLHADLGYWQAQGVGAVDRRLWLVCLGLWSAVAAIGWIALRERAFGDRARLVFTLPLTPAGRARALVGECGFKLIAGFGLTLLAGSAALVERLGGESLGWMALALAGAAVALWGVLLTLMGWMSRTRAGRVKVAIVLGGIGLAVLLVAVALVVRVAQTGAVTPVALERARRESSMHGSVAPPSPWLGAAGALTLLAILAGPLAGPAGRLYERAFLLHEAGSGRPHPRLLLRRLTRPLTAWRGPTGALLVRDLLLRGRQGLEWLRAALFGAALVLLFPWLRPLLAAQGFPGPLGLVAALTATALFYILDGSSSPLGAEGSRLTLFLSAPIPLRILLRAKVWALFLPLLAAGLAGAWLLGLRSALPWSEILWAEGATALTFLGLALVFALGSAWDADLELEIEPGLRGVVQESAPTTSVRMALFLAASGLATVELVLPRRLPPPASLAALALLDAVLLAILQGPAARALRRQVRRG